MSRGWAFILWWLMLAGALQPVVGDPAKKGFLLELNGVVGPASADYFDRNLSLAEEAGAELVILRMDTPGGLDVSMRAIIKRIISAKVPVISYVAPGGARAASAGTYILYASHVAAMAPGTNLGAATPVSLVGSSGQDKQNGSPQEGAPKQPAVPSGDAKTRKVVNDAAAYIRGLAQLRGRNAEWAESAVREAASLSAKEALKAGVIDLIAGDLPSLLAQLNHRQVALQSGSRQLDTDGMSLELKTPDWRNQLLSIIANPNIAYLLMLVGIYGIIYEFASPGAILPGTAGAISLLLALYAFQLLPVNYAGVALILMSLGLMVAEAFVPSFGALGISGVVAFVIGSLILIDTDQPGYGISLPLIITVAVASVFLLVLIAGMALKSYRRPVVSGGEGMTGELAMALEDFAGRGRVRVHGEVWDAHSEHPVQADQSVRIIGRKGLVLEVSPVNKEESS